MEMSEFLLKEFHRRFYRMCDFPESSAPVYYPFPPTTISGLVTGGCKKVGRGGKLVMTSANRMLALRNAADAAKQLKVPRRHGNRLTVEGVRVVFTWLKKDSIRGKSSAITVDEWHDPRIMEG